MDEAVLRIVLDEGGGSQPSAPPAHGQNTPPASGVAPPPPPPRPTPPPPPPPPLPVPTGRGTQPQPVSTNTISSYRAIADAVVSARHDADAFNRAMTDVQANLFKLRHGVDPQAIAKIFVSGKDAAKDLIKELNEVEDLLRSGAITEVEGARMAREAVGRRAESVQPPTELAKNRDWMKDLVEGVGEAARHVLIEGGTGGGKSVLTHNIAFERAKRGEEVNVLDPHNPETWKGVKEVFTRDTAQDFAKKMIDTLRGREKEGIEAKARGEKIDFSPITFVLSDFAAIAKQMPAMKDAVNQVLTEGRKFKVNILAETAGFNAAQMGAGVQGMRSNFPQIVQATKEVIAGKEERRVSIGAETFASPNLTNALKQMQQLDPSIVRYKSAVPPEPPAPAFDPRAEAKKKLEAEERRKAVDAEYAKMKPQEPGRGVLGSVIDTATAFRGTIGGVVGPAAGAGLDVVSQAAAGGLAGVAGAAGAAVVAFGALTNAIDKSVERYGDYSPDIASAQASVEIQKTMNDMRRAQEHGADLARYVESQGRMQEKFEEAKMKFLTKIMPIIEAIFDFLGFIMDGIGNIPALAESIASPLSSIASSAGEALAKQRDDRFPKDDDAPKDPTDFILKRGGREFEVPGL